ncbi:hypothetical protein CEE36_06690 [candidate division TA06 bacterium B3_TA06]|uniref:Potassium channel domain-containing protein n=1 Tax=candidate division TA06 bacterium B3_TA06 TaxID=2012487 RepID=A0A532V6E5_UNCT6|nr:MAG: hypothetical protein CEE36_06690 [candidate division TA06 bacterium B3_TA06]
MAKRKTQPLPDPKVGNKCKVANCNILPLFNEDYCGMHLPSKRRTHYKKRVQTLFRKGVSLAGAELWLANLEGVDLRGADLTNATLSGANLKEAFLVGANLQGAYLNGANLQRAFLPNSNLYKADLTHINLERANLSESYLPEVELRNANLKNAVLENANLQKAHVYEANLYGADLKDAYLKETDFSYSNLENTKLRRATLTHAHLTYTQMKEADLTAANLRSASLFWTDLRAANLNSADLNGAFMEGVLLDEARYLTWEQVGRVGEETIRVWDGARDAYRRLKNYFHQQGQYGDESKAYYREKLMVKHEAFWECFRGGCPYDVEERINHKTYHAKETLWDLRRLRKGKPFPGRGRKYFSLIYELVHPVLFAPLRLFIKWLGLILYLFLDRREYLCHRKKKPLKHRFHVFFRYLRKMGYTFRKAVIHTAKRIKALPRWLGLWFMHVFAGFGERWWLTALWAVGFIIGFGFLYFLGSQGEWAAVCCKGEAITTIWDAWYFSVVTFVTLGFGDITPTTGLAKLFVVAEVVMGYVFLGTLVTLIARKMMR